MKKLLVFLLVCPANYDAFAQHQYIGYWKGAVSRDGAVQSIEVNFKRSDDSVTATYNLPDMGMYDEPLPILSATDSLLSVKTFMGVFHCIFNATHYEITGENRNWKPIGLKLHLKKMATPASAFHSKELNVPLMKGKIAGTLYTPLTKGKHPLVIIAHGAQDPTRNNWVYRYFANLLPQYGYAVYLFDQRTAATGTTALTLQDHAADIENIAAYFKKKNVSDKIAIIGTSRGGWVAGIAAASSNLFKTVIAVAGPSKGPIDLEYDVVQSVLKAEGFRQAEIDSALSYTMLYFKTVADSTFWPQLSALYRSIKPGPWSYVLQDVTYWNDEGMQWWRNNDHHTGKYLAKVKCPVLAIFGSEDILVPPANNVDLMKQYLTSSGKENKVITINGLPHGLYRYQTLTNNAFSWPTGYWIWPKRSWVLDEEVIQWLEEHLKK